MKFITNLTTHILLKFQVNILLEVRYFMGISFFGIRQEFECKICTAISRDDVIIVMLLTCNFHGSVVQRPKVTKFQPLSERCLGVILKKSRGHGPTKKMTYYCHVKTGLKNTENIQTLIKVEIHGVQSYSRAQMQLIY